MRDRNRRISQVQQSPSAALSRQTVSGDIQAERLKVTPRRRQETGLRVVNRNEIGTNRAEKAMTEEAGRCRFPSRRIPFRRS